MKIVIVGCGVAGVTAAKVLRKNKPDAQIAVYSDENHLYYPRPRLYEILSGEKEPQEIYSYAQKWYEQLGINVQLNKKITKINVAEKEVIVDGNEKINYDKLLLANGAHPFVPPTNGIEKKGVFTLRTLENALTIRQWAQKTKKAIVIGGGLLGLEFAACLRKLGQQVKVIEIQSRLLPVQLDQESSEILRDSLEDLGIDSVLGVKIREIMGNETVSGVSLDNGQEISGELALISAGIRSNIDLAAEAGIKVNKGVVVNEYLQTSADDVYAAGDVCEFNGRVYGIIPPAIEQAESAAKNLLGIEKRVYKGTIHSTTLKIAGISLTSMGITNPEGAQYEEVKRIDEKEGVYRKIVLDNGEIVGAILLGDRKGTSELMKLTKERRNISKYKNQLLEDDFDYRKIG
jgi:NAD(P)H-nitrite reductase large subunit